MKFSKARLVTFLFLIVLISENLSAQKSKNVGLQEAATLSAQKSANVSAKSTEENFPNGVKRDYELKTTGGFVQAKNYYLLTLFSASPDVRSLFANDKTLSSLSQKKLAALPTRIKACANSKACILETIRFSDEEIKTAAQRLKTLYSSSPILKNLVENELIPSGCYYLFNKLSPDELLVRAWEQDATGINFAINVYAAGERAKYPKIDSASLNIKDPRDTTLFTKSHSSLIYSTAWMIADKFAATPQFYNAPLEFALRFIEYNERNQAADFESMEKGENKKAVDATATTNWTSYPYSMILLPGAGPNDPEIPLSAEGMIRCQLAASQYKMGVAPFIMPSGGRVHPYKTKFCEATEMKRYLIEALDIPESAIIIDPHARHTTTNLRNAARLMFRYGIPFNKPAISCTTPGQTTAISETLEERCKRELGLVPFKAGTRINDVLVEFHPLPDALHINPTEPLDP